jgi:alpha/beta superfamily hydrolase
MDEEQLFFSSGALKIEGLFHAAPGSRGAVVSHPHPLYGGSMYSGVVEAITRVYRESGYATLRFNFRGVGESEGSYDQGRGEQEDLGSAVRFLCTRGKTRIDLAGYSFGAWVSALVAATQAPVERLILFSPPVAFLDFRAISSIPGLRLVITGSRDQIAPAEQIRTLLPSWNPEARLEVVEGADHFYGGYIERLKALLAGMLGPEDPGRLPGGQRFG